jgi:hypothetical protein
MPKTYCCMSPSGERHRFVEGTDAYRELLALEANKHMGAPFWCPYDNSSLFEEPENVRPDTQYALIMLAADVSGSMFTEVVLEGGAKTKATQVIESLADVLRDLSLPNAGTANSLLVGLLTFASRALWVDAHGSGIDFSPDPVVLTVTELVQKLIGLHTGRDITTRSDRSVEIDALRGSLNNIFLRASDLCGGTGTNYEAALAACAATLRDVQDPTKRRGLRPDWEVIYKDSRKLAYLRTVFYSDGVPNLGKTGTADLGAQCREAFPNDNVPLITSSFVSPDQGGAEEAEGTLREMSSLCPVHKTEKCMFPGADARRFRDIIRMASGGSGFCPRCLRERQRT